MDDFGAEEHMTQVGGMSLKWGTFNVIAHVLCGCVGRLCLCLCACTCLWYVFGSWVEVSGKAQCRGGGGVIVLLACCLAVCGGSGVGWGQYI